MIILTASEIVAILLMMLTMLLMVRLQVRCHESMMESDCKGLVINNTKSCNLIINVTKKQLITLIFLIYVVLKTGLVICNCC